MHMQVLGKAESLSFTCKSSQMAKGHAFQLLGRAWINICCSLLICDSEHDSVFSLIRELCFYVVTYTHSNLLLLGNMQMSPEQLPLFILTFMR